MKATISCYDRVQELDRKLLNLRSELYQAETELSSAKARKSHCLVEGRCVSLLLALRSPRLGMTYDVWCVALILLVPLVSAATTFVALRLPTSAWVSGFVFVLTAITVVLALVVPPTPSLESSYYRRTEEASALDARMRQLNLERDNLLRLQEELNRERETLVTSIEFLRAGIEEKGRHLLSSAWESFQGVAFEDFLVRVFENLGATVHLTPVSGDQGADLIATFAGRRFAIQAKGGISVIGNGAVMEVLGGLHYYGCDNSVVITNSSFTRKAVELAQRANCVLVDGPGVVELALGRHPKFPPTICCPADTRPTTAPSQH